MSDRLPEGENKLGEVWLGCFDLNQSSAIRFRDYFSIAIAAEKDSGRLSGSRHR
jgi:hypothetical protein